MFRSFVTIDFETWSSVELDQVGADVYAEDPNTEILCLWAKGKSGNKKGWHPGEDGEWLRKIALDPNILFVAHGTGFEKAIWRRIMVPVYGFPDIPNERWHCTQAMAAYKAVPLALDKLATALEIPIPKDMEGNALIKKLSQLPKATKRKPTPAYMSITTEVMERVDAYCQTDCDSQDLVFKRLGLFPEPLRMVWLAYEAINERGVLVDQRFVANCLAIVEQTQVPLGAEFSSITGGIQFTQRDAFLKWLNGQGVKIPDLQKETVEEWLGLADNPGDDAPEPLEEWQPEYRALYLRYLIGSASVKKLPRLRDCCCLDGRARRMLQFHGAAPGRSTGRLIQPQNFPRGTIKLDAKNKLITDQQKIDAVYNCIMQGSAELVEAAIGPAIETVVSSLRFAFIPAHRHCYVAGDYSGIQARTVLALAGQYDKAEVMAAGLDVYCDMASQIYKREITKADQEERQLGKNSVLGLGFGMGGRKFYLKYGKGHTLGFMRSVVNIYRKEWAPEVPKLWRALDWASTETVWTGRPHEAFGVEYAIDGDWLRCTLPSGRCIWYARPSAVSRPMPLFDDEGNTVEDDQGRTIYSDTDFRPGWKYYVAKNGGWRPNYAFGGLLTENVVMGIETDIKFDAILKAEANGFPIVMDIHDELVAEVLSSTADEKGFKQIMEDVKPWVKHLKIPVQVGSWSGDRYRKAA